MGTIRGRAKLHDNDPIRSAQAAGLRYSSDDRPGIRRIGSGKTFRYVRPDGRVVKDEPTLSRIRALAIPPAWTDVWICPGANGHMQATGRDARKRKQHRYHPRWREVRDRTKFGRLIDLAAALPRMRRAVDRDLAQAGLPRDKVLAAVVRLLERTHVRVGNDEYARTNNHFGLTTLLDRHVAVRGSAMRFRFLGKGGKAHALGLEDPRLARIVRRCQEIPGQRLFQYQDEQGEPHAITSNDVNDYLRAITGDDFTAKDLRTWAGTVCVATRLLNRAAPATAQAAKDEALAAIDEAALALGNTRAVCRSSYVHPAVLRAFEEGWIATTRGTDASRATAGLSRHEAATLRLLRLAAARRADRPTLAPALRRAA